MEQLFTRLFEIFSLEYIVCVILTSYFLIKIIDYFNGVRQVPTWIKRVITFVVGFGYIVFFKQVSDITIQCLASSFFVALFIYDGAIKYLIKKFDVDYKK